MKAELGVVSLQGRTLDLLDRSALTITTTLLEIMKNNMILARIIISVRCSAYTSISTLNTSV